MKEWGVNEKIVMDKYRAEFRREIVSKMFMLFSDYLNVGAVFLKNKNINIFINLIIYFLSRVYSDISWKLKEKNQYL